MDNADLSINANAIGDYHGLDAHKKALMGHNHSDLDSGFAENWSISQATASTSGLSSSSKYTSMSFKKSLDLETIAENNEVKDLQDTPTTRGLRQFYITTPQTAGHYSETTPRKENVFSSHFDSGSRGSNKKNRSQNSIRWSSPKPKSQRKSSFSTQTRLFASIDEDSDSIFMGKENSEACNQSIGFSPIKPHNNSSSTSTNMTAAQADKQGIQRHPSGIEASTPKTFRRAQTIVKPQAKDGISNPLRKVQSHSPRRTALRERSINFQSSFEPDDILLEDDEQRVEPNPVPNPAKKILDFNPQTFEKLTQSNREVQKTPSKLNHANKIGGSINGSASKKSKNVQLKRLDTQKSRVFKEISRKKSMKLVAMTPTKTQQSFNESDILASLNDAKETDSCGTASNTVGDENLMDISDSALSIIRTPSTNDSKQTKAVTSDTPIRSDFVEHNIREEANRTPTKRFVKSTSCNYPSVKTSPEKEKNDILFGCLPCTPQKNRQRKRPAASRSPQLNEPSAKRKIDIGADIQADKYKVCERNTFFYGLDKLDMLTQLEKKNNFDIIDKIFGYLPDDAVHAAYSVSKSWRKIIDKNALVCLRRRNYVRSMRPIKENLHDTIKPINLNNNNNVKPLHEHNLNCSQIEERPVPMSPSTRRFIETQKIISSWRRDQHAVHCPLCNETSIVFPANETKLPRRSPRRLQQYTSRGRYNSSLTKMSQGEYAVCQKRSCSFEFCTNCYGDRHPNSTCPKPPLGSSPKSDDESQWRIENRRTIKNRTKSLKRLEL